MKPIFLCEDSSAIPPHAPTGGFRYSVLTQRFFALTRFSQILSVQIRCFPWTGSGHRRVIRVQSFRAGDEKRDADLTETTDFRRFYPCKSVVSVSSVFYFSGQSIAEFRLSLGCSTPIRRYPIGLQSNQPLLSLTAYCHPAASPTCGRTVIRHPFDRADCG